MVGARLRRPGAEAAVGVELELHQVLDAAAQLHGVAVGGVQNPGGEGVEELFVNEEGKGEGLKPPVKGVCGGGGGGQRQVGEAEAAVLHRHLFGVEVPAVKGLGGVFQGGVHPVKENPPGNPGCGKGRAELRGSLFRSLLGDYRDGVLREPIALF